MSNISNISSSSFVVKNRHQGAMFLAERLVSGLKEFNPSKVEFKRITCSAVFQIDVPYLGKVWMSVQVQREDDSGWFAVSLNAWGKEVSEEDLPDLSMEVPFLKDIDEEMSSAFLRAVLSQLTCLSAMVMDGVETPSQTIARLDEEERKAYEEAGWKKLHARSRSQNKISGRDRLRFGFMLLDWNGEGGQDGYGDYDQFGLHDYLDRTCYPGRDC